MSTWESMSQTAKTVTSITMVEGEDLTGEELQASKQILLTTDQVSWTIPDKNMFSSDVNKPCFNMDQNKLPCLRAVH